MKLSPFAVSSVGVLFLLVIGLFGQTQLIGRIIDVEPVLQQIEQKTQRDFQQAQQTLSPAAQQTYDVVMQQAMQKIDQNALQWAQKASPAICKVVSQATSAGTVVNQLIQQLSRSVLGAAQAVLSSTIKATIKITQGDPEAQQKIADAQAIANAGIQPLTAYTAQKILSIAVKQCPEETTSPAAEQVQRVAPALSTQTRSASSAPSREITRTDASSAFESQKQITEGPIGGGGIGASQQQGIDVAFNDLLFYYENAMSMHVDKDKLEPSGRLVPQITARNKGSSEAKDVEISISVDGGTEDKKRLGNMAANSVSGLGFFLPVLSGGQHELTVKIIAKDDVTPENNVAKILFTILTDGSLKELTFSYVDERRSVLSTPVDTNAVDPTKNLVASIFVRNEGRTLIPEAEVVMAVDGKEQKETVRNIIGRTGTGFDLKGLTIGKQDITFTLNLKGDKDSNNNVIKSTLTVVQPAQQMSPPPVPPQPIPPAVEPPKPAKNVDVGFKDAVFYYKHIPNKPIDKNAIEYSYEKTIDVTVTNFGTEPIQTVDVNVREDDRNFEVKRFMASNLLPGASQTRQFLGRDTMSSQPGNHKLAFRLEAKGDTNPANNIGIIDFTIIDTPEQQLWPDLKLSFTKDKPLEQDGKPIGFNEAKANKYIFGSINLRNIVKHEKSRNIVVSIKVDDKQLFKEELFYFAPADWPGSADKVLTFSIPPLTAGTHKFVATATADNEATPADNTITANILVTEEKPAIPPVVEQPKPPVQELPDIELKLPREDWLEQEGKFLKPTELKTGASTGIPFFGTVLVNNKGTKSGKNVVVSTTIDGEEIDRKSYDEISLNPPVSYGSSGTFNAYTYGFGSGTKKLWPGKHQLRIVATTADVEITKDNNVITAELLISDEKGSQAPINAMADIRVEKVTVAQWDIDKKDYVDKEFGPGGSILREDMPFFVHLYLPKDSPSFTYDVLIDGEAKKSESNGAKTVNGQGVYYRQFYKLSPGKHHLKVILDPQNFDYETNEANNVFETDFYIKEKPLPPIDVKLSVRSRAEFDDAQAKSTGRNRIQFFIESFVTGKLPQKIPLFVQAGDKTTKLELDSTPLGGGRYDVQYGVAVEQWAKQVTGSVDVDRNKFPTEIYVRADIDDSDKTNNALIMPVVVVKDGKFYTI